MVEHLYTLQKVGFEFGLDTDQLTLDLTLHKSNSLQLSYMCIITHSLSQQVLEVVT